MKYKPNVVSFYYRNSSAIIAPIMLIPNGSDKHPGAKCYGMLATCYNYSSQHSTNKDPRLEFQGHHMHRIDRIALSSWLNMMEDVRVLIR